MKTAAAMFLALICGFGHARAQIPPAKPIQFPGYVISDSLEYSARTIDYSVEHNRAVMHDNATAKYLGYVLTSAGITYYRQEQYVSAEGRPDSAGALTDTPIFTDKNGQELKGRIIEYDLKSGAGVVADGRSKYETGYMAFRRVKRVAADTLYVEDGTYTTCDIAESPHYWFAGKQMKLIMDDKLIIKPITAYLHKIPVFWFPFYVFPITQGRQSGFLTPRYGSSRQDGRYLSNMGYYVAPSEYWDYRVAGTLRERNGWLVKNWMNYNVRYLMTGSAYMSFEDRSGGSRQWILQASHSHTVSPTLQITGDANFQSSQFSRNNSYNIYERLNRDMRSSLTVTKRWKESGNSLITTFGHYKNLDSKNTSTTLPNISFRKPRKLLFGGEKTTTVRRKYMPKEPEAEPGKAPWYESIYYSFGADFKNMTDKAERTGAPDETFTRDFGFSTSLSSSNRIRGWLVTEPSLNLNEGFSTSNGYADSVKFRRRDTLTFGMSLGTTLYGMFQPNIAGVKGIRHVLAPTATWSFGKNRQYGAPVSDAFYRFDKNDADRSAVNSLDLNVRNIFQVKTVKDDKENKIDLFTLNFSSSVDFEQEEKKVSPLSTTLDFRPAKFISTRASVSHSFYDAANRFRLFSPTTENFSFTTDVGLTQESLRFMGNSSKGSANSMRGRDDLDLDMPARTEGGGDVGGGSSSMPFSLRFSHSYGFRRVYGKPGKYTTTHDVKPEIGFSPSSRFNVNYFFYYDIVKKEIVSQRATIYRDLHCFEAALSWIPSGIQEGFYFKVSIKDLPDVKLEKRRGSSRLGY